MEEMEETEKMRRLQGLWDTMKHKLGRKHQSRRYCVPGEAGMHDGYHKVTAEHDARGKDLKNTTGKQQNAKARL